MRIAVFLFIAGFSLSPAGAAPAPYTERGKTDFDTFLKVLAPHGTWKKEGPAWRFSPAKPVVPMTDGQWIYTDWGWYFRGASPISDITDHYGRWLRGEGGAWVWQPDPLWHAQKVEWRGTATHVGWRPARLNREGGLVESEEERFAHPEEWIFVPRGRLKGMILPRDAASAEETKTLLEKSEPLSHIFVTYREIERMGPDPFQVLPATKEAVTYRREGEVDAPSLVPAPATAVSTEDGEAAQPTKPTFSYYTIMSLPTPGAALPSLAKSSELYAYRPVLFQDGDGIFRRVEMFLNPRPTRPNRESVNLLLQGKSLETATNGPIGPPAPLKIVREKAGAAPPPVPAEKVGPSAAAHPRGTR